MRNHDTGRKPDGNEGGKCEPKWKKRPEKRHRIEFFNLYLWLMGRMVFEIISTNIHEYIIK